MKYFYDPETGEHYGFEEDGSQDYLIKDTYVNSSLQDISPKNIDTDIRNMRNMKLTMEVDPLVSNPLRWADLSDATKQLWIDYRRALLDIPTQSGFPHDVVWPIRP